MSTMRSRSNRPRRVPALAALAAVAGVGAACLVAASSAAAAPSLDAYAGAIGGAGIGTVPGGCSMSPAKALDFFTFNGFTLPPEGIAACGYSGGLDQASAATGPLTLAKSLPAVSLGPRPSEGSFTGNAQSVARYGSLGASAHGDIGLGRPTGSVALYESVGAARFNDTLTASSPMVSALSAGFVSYRFAVDGRLDVPGTPAPYYFGETYFVLDVQHQGGPVYEVMNAHTRRGGVSTISNGPPGAGWTTGPGLLDGAGSFEIKDFPMVWGQPWEVSVGLLSWAYGSADANFLSTAKLTGLTLYDAHHVEVTTFSLSAASGTAYLAPVPEPAAAALLALGLGALGWLQRAGRRRVRG
ncbi:MAG: PEP-CTERM sorting domain-containing protein [Rubrivivax sp.]|nr:MAG: PEP-CTERM sorting domain-containing protein [Rubrivivax sp.]